MCGLESLLSYYSFRWYVGNMSNTAAPPTYYYPTRTWAHQGESLPLCTKLPRLRGW